MVGGVGDVFKKAVFVRVNFVYQEVAGGDAGEIERGVVG